MISKHPSKIIIILGFLFLLCVSPLFAQEQDSLDIMISRQIELFGFSEDNTLAEVSSIVNISVDSLVTQFKLSKKDKKIASRRLKNLRLDPENIVLFRDTIKYGFNHNFSLFEISKKLNIPIKKLLEYLDLNIQDKTNYNKSLLELHISTQEIDIINKKFIENKPEFGAILTIIGMLVVFCALIITALVISQMAHFNKKTKVIPATSSVQTPVGTITTKKKEDLSSAAIVAVITAIHMRMHELDEESKIMLTWKRANISMWQATGKVQFPNSQYDHLRK